MNQFLGSLALLPVEKILNAIVARDPHIAKKLAAFDSKCIEVVSHRPDFSLSIRFEDGTIKLSAIDSQTLGIQADATITGNAESLLGLLTKKSDQRALADSAIDISGDATLVQDLHVTIESLDVEWQDYLTPILGDVLSNELGEIHNNARDWSKSAGTSMHRGIRDYLSEEASLVPSELELDSFSNRLDQLRLSIDRVAAKTELLKRRYSLLAQPK
ncbi:MAG: SCP2 sterol-binding domain-containing protein [Proteobacteria bacterium]|nr:SCP2 sterol-binding domain-containing protein [Pseudomonadota bacterium]MDA1291041.1 SCP2 sterol-binding domain-containing protein [Pseudomonadota bacterium]